jgi:uncharacterized membrane protein HdeD (DUF308 family)
MGEHGAGSSEGGSEMAMASRHRIGMILLGIYLVIAGLVIVFEFHIVYLGLIQGVLALLAGIFILLSR